MSEPKLISGAVEGLVDEAVLRRLVVHVGAEPGPIYGKDGKRRLRQRLNGYNQAARLGPWIVLVDLDQDAICAPLLRADWLAEAAPMMCFRIAVRETEAWLLADRQRLSPFLGVSVSRIPPNPDTIADPKQFVVDLASVSRRRDIRMDMVPRPGSGRTVGPAYTSRLIEFVSNSQDGWQPDVAASYSDSLQRCLIRLKELISHGSADTEQRPPPRVKGRQG